MNQDDPFLPQVTTLHAAGDAERGWDQPPFVEPAGWWIVVRNRQAVDRPQGWKLHVSAGIPTADAVLERALPVLLAEPVNFKVAASRARLAELISTDDNFSQIGKFITVYPSDDAQAVRLAVALHAATQDLRGPAIPSDRPLVPGSLVYYRYGAFHSRWMQQPSGEIEAAIAGPDGELVPDPRLPTYLPPAWAEDPFLAAGVAAPIADPGALIGGRYLVLKTLTRMPRGTIARALDVSAVRRCIIKRAGRDAVLDRHGRDARDRLRHEAAMLARVAPDPRFPGAYEIIEQENELFLVMEDVRGQTVHDYMMDLASKGRFLPAAQVVAWGRELAAMLATIHACGLVYCDIKPTNVIVAPDGHLRLIDFDIGYDPTGTEPPLGRGTPGYMSPQQKDNQTPAIADDVYGVGCLLYYMATGADPSYAAPNCPPAWINPAVPPALAELIARCRATEREARYATMPDLDAALAALAMNNDELVAAPDSEDSDEAPPEHYGALARRLADSLCKVLRRAYDPPTPDPAAKDAPDRDLYSGSGGLVLALAELVDEFDDPALRDVLAESARWLITAPGPESPPLPGLYKGQAGIGAALLRAGQVLGDADLIAAAEARGRQVAALPFASPDLTTGAAGRLRFHLWLWDETGAPEHLHAALAAGDWLLAHAEEIGDGGWCWQFPAEFSGFHGKTHVGYAHGAAGIADTLLDLYDATGDPRYRAGAARAGRWIADLAVPMLDDDSGIGWPPMPDKPADAGFWCHGAPGIGRFWLHAAALDLLPEAADLVTRAARTVAQGTRWAGPVQCHGLASNIEFLLDVYQARGDDAHRAAAWAQARILELFAAEQDGDLIWPSDVPKEYSPAYMSGYAGVAVCLLRLADPARRPHQLSRVRFRPAKLRAVVGVG